VILPLVTLLRTVERYLPRALVSRRALRALRSRAAQIPSAWFSGCVECRLTEAEDQSDLLVYATRGAGGQQALGRLLAAGGGGEFGAARPFLAAWTNRRSPLSRELSMMWLEYDLPPVGPAPDPFAFVCLYPDYLDPIYPRHRSGSPLPAARVRSIAASGLRAALRAPVERRRLDLVTRCAARLPLHGRLLHVVARPPAGDGGGSAGDLRIGAILPSDRVGAWLDEIGWPGRRQQLELLDHVLGRGTDFVHVQVELSDELRSKLAIDFADSTLPSPSPRARQFVERLAATGCAVKAKALAAFQWMRSWRFDLPGERIPTRIDHQLFFKVSTTPDAVSAKAYLLFQPRYALG
jgi:hypothetical protein